MIARGYATVKFLLVSTKDLIDNSCGWPISRAC